MASPPPLPDRKPSGSPPPPPYSLSEEAPAGFPARPATGDINSPGPRLGLFADPRSSSSQSLVPSSSSASDPPKRTLLVVYIHGFYGNDQSFRSFPAHVHNYLRAALSESHVIHSKIYPRYKTYRAIDIARDNFSAWLDPHESPTTDVILVGHSMGGLLAAEVVLKPNQSPYLQHPFKHRILGTVSLDSPFLGLHPGIVVSGISSLFNPAPKPSDGEQSSPSPAAPLDSPSTDLQLQSPPEPQTPVERLPRWPTDPNFDPPYFNDEPFREQPLFTRMLHFASKHRSEGLFQAMGNHIAYHLEFGGCLADFHGLISRYGRIRALEDVDELQALRDGHSGGACVRVHFVNYYTLCSGRPKPSQSPSGGSRSVSQTDLSTFSTGQREAQSQDGGTPAAAAAAEEIISPSSSLSDLEPKGDEPNDDTQDRDPVMESGNPHKESVDANVDEAVEPLPDLSCLSMREIDPIPMDEQPKTNLEDTPDGEQAADPQPLPTDLNLLPVPDLPPKPEQPDLDQYTDKDSRKQAEKEFHRLQKAYDKALKDRTKTMREREKLLEKRARKAQKEAAKLEKEARKEKERLEKQEKKEEEKRKKRCEEEEEETAAAQQQQQQQVNEEEEEEEERPTTAICIPGVDDEEKDENEAEAQEKEQEQEQEEARPQKLRRFCNLPAKVNGEMDPTWVDVYMRGVDEVGAHCGLFFPGPHYEKLVGDVGSRIVSWAHDDLSKRALLDMAS